MKAGGGDEVTIVVGAEHDAAAFARLKAALAALGAVPGGETWGVAGSQEVATWTVRLDGEAMTVEAETYRGLSVTGAPEQIAKVAEALERVGAPLSPP